MVGQESTLTATPFVSMVYVLIAAFIGSLGAVCLKWGASRIRRHWTTLLFNRQLLAGIVLFGVSSVFFVLGVRNGELSILYPLVSTSYVWALVWSKLWFDEPITRTKVIGIGLILFGVTLLGLGTH